MPAAKSSAHKPRELRRRVMVPARLRCDGSWSDTCILNISSRGMLVHTGRPIARGTEVEIHRGDRVIVARVIWRNGGRTGLQSNEIVPVEEMMILGPCSSLRLTATADERPQQRRPEDYSRFKGRAIEFAGVAIIAASLAGAGVTMTATVFARPLAIVQAALDN